MDEDELAAMASGKLQKTQLYDSLGGVQARRAQRESLLALKHSPWLSVPFADEVFAPVPDTLGAPAHQSLKSTQEVKLSQKTTIPTEVA